MSELTTSRTEHHIICGQHEWMVSGPLTELAPQLVSVHTFRSGVINGGVSIPADEIGLLIEALTTIRDAMKEGTA